MALIQHFNYNTKPWGRPNVPVFVSGLKNCNDSLKLHRAGDDCVEYWLLFLEKPCVTDWTAAAVRCRNSKCISFLWFSLQIQFPSFPRSNFTPCIPFPAKAAPPQNSCTIISIGFLYGANHCRLVFVNIRRCFRKFFRPVVGSISDGSTALRHSATFRSRVR